MDALAFRLANRVVGNPRRRRRRSSSRVSGPTLRFRDATPRRAERARACAPTLDGVSRVALWAAVRVRARPDARARARSTAPGARAYLPVRGGFDVPEYLGSRATFTLGRFGGHGGRALRAGDVLHLARQSLRLSRQRLDPQLDARATSDTGRSACCTARTARPTSSPPTRHRDVVRDRVEGALQLEPHRRAADRAEARVGARRTAARRGCTRRTSTTTPTPIGTVDFTGDMPIILGPDGPSLGGFVCPATVIARRALEDRPAHGRRHACASCPWTSNSRTRCAASTGATTRSPRCVQSHGAARCRAVRRPGASAPRSSPRAARRASGRCRRTGRPATAICWSSTGRSCSIWGCASACTR